MMVVGDTLSRWTFRDFDGRIIREFKSDMLQDWIWEEDEFYGDGILLGGETQEWQYGSSEIYGGPRHYHLDHLGSVRVVTDGNHRSLSENDYYPFGTTMTRTYQEQLNWGDPHIDSMRFTGQWRDFLGNLNVDNTDYLDYMHARYYDPNWGRFLSVDPIIPKAAMRSPQLWNRYAYVGNNPINRVDPDGRVLQLSGCVKDSGSDQCKAQFNAYTATFGSHAAEAAKYLQVGKNGIVGFKGISGGAFAAQFGLMGRATNYLVSNRVAVFTMTMGRNAETASNRGAYSEVNVPAGGRFGVDPSSFPNS
ncbi:MAG TPA: RHS repeat-associated core domain-containing protein, partial [Thermoanaerobaculia bacterium]|nr:RHS repeat-associated core domain-containing protein [Thermoanaerobaculia bacterium]